MSKQVKSIDMGVLGHEGKGDGESEVTDLAVRDATDSDGRRT